MEFNIMTLDANENVLLMAPAAEETASAVKEFEGETNVEHMLETLPMMGKGLLGIFIVTIIIVASTIILNKVFSGKKKSK